MAAWPKSVTRVLFFPLRNSKKEKTTTEPQRAVRRSVVV
jgi:hypothetical protein